MKILDLELAFEITRDFGVNNFDRGFSGLNFVIDLVEFDRFHEFFSSTELSMLHLNIICFDRTNRSVDRTAGPFVQFR